MGKFVITKTKQGFKFGLVVADGIVLATSQHFEAKTSCKKAISAIQKIAFSPIENKTTKPLVLEKNPKYEIYKDRKKEYGFRLIAKNGEQIFGGTGYATFEGCLSAIKSIQNNIKIEIVDATLEKNAPQKNECCAPPKKNVRTRQGTKI